jgi:fatty acid desaturase
MTLNTSPPVTTSGAAPGSGAAALGSTEAAGTAAKRGYADLKRLIRERGLIERQPRFLLVRVAINLVLLGVGIAFLFAPVHLAWQIVNAIYLAFVFGQIAFIGHDAGHRQGFKQTSLNDIVGLIHTNLLLGMSFAWWNDKHNAHHAHPNQHDMDPDIAMVVLAFSEEDALTRKGIFRFMVAHQARLFFFLLLFQAWSLRVGSIGFLISKPTRRRWLELALLTANLVGFLAILISALGVWPGIAFFLVQQALFGLYLASVFAPNHKGMLVLDEDHELDFLHQQVLTARNVVPGPFTDIWYGGLNYQIEHHLFPTLARNKLKEAHLIIKRFCQEEAIPYYETTMVQSYREILTYLHEVSAKLRQPRATA